VVKIVSGLARLDGVCLNSLQTPLLNDADRTFTAVSPGVETGIFSVGIISPTFGVLFTIGCVTLMNAGIYLRLAGVGRVTTLREKKKR